MNAVNTDPYRPEAADIAYEPSRPLGWFERLRLKHPVIVALLRFMIIGTVLFVGFGLAISSTVGVVAWFLSEIVPGIFWMWAPYAVLVFVTVWCERLGYENKPICRKCGFYRIEIAERKWECPKGHDSP